MSPLKVALPGATAFLFQQLFLRLAEGEEIGIARNDDRFGQGVARVNVDDFPDGGPVGLLVGHGSGRIKSGVVEELASGTRDHKAGVSIVRFWFFGRMSHFSRGGIDLIVPE